MANNLLIVESPGKVKKIQSILGDGWDVQASVGHVRDLPTKEIGVAPPEFRPHYVPTERGKSVIAKLKQCVGAAQEVYLATDPDREGESISWHLKQVLGLTSPHRVTFNEITPAAVKAAVAQPRTIDTKLVAAQEARRVLDRLVGYTVSPRLSDALGQTASAGRVQTPALRLVVEREREIRAFKPTKHFGVQLLFSGPQGDWIANWNCKPLLPKDQAYWLNEAFALQVARVRDVVVEACKEETTRRAPPAPFTTSTMQQGASAALKLNPKSTMQAAQRLYEQGAITYHRTDNPNLSADAIAELTAYAQAAGLPLAPQQRRWKAKDGAQEAHEAIRPTHFEVESAGESADERRLYQLIRLRALASQLADAVYDVRTLILRADLPIDGKRIEFIARGRTLKVAGWLSLTQSDATDESEQAEPDNPVPKLAEMDTLTAKDGKLLRKVTEPPRRYTQASLVKALEEEGIGRPATYAAIMDNIVSRDYVREEKKKFLVPTELGESVIDALVGRFAFADIPFTRSLEEQLDRIAQGKAAYRGVITGAHAQLVSEMVGFQAAAPAPCHPCPECGKALRRIRKKDRSGWFWGCSGYPDCDVTRPDAEGQPVELPPKAETAAESSPYRCHECHKPLAKRPGKKGTFWGCTGYPECKVTLPDDDGKPGIRDVSTKTSHEESHRHLPKDPPKVAVGDACPQCKKGKLQRKPLKDKFFLGCNNYPSCRFFQWST